jgi:hypothetical protein
MYVFNTGGTMTESSNYDGAPPVPPAYGVWRSVGPNEFEAKMSTTRPHRQRQPIHKARFLHQDVACSSGLRFLLGPTFTSTMKYDAST